MALGVWGNKYQGLLNDPRIVQGKSVVPQHPFAPPGTDGGDNNTGSVKNSKPAQNEDEAGGG